MCIRDRPTTALDVTIQAQVLDLMAELGREIGSAIVLVTHDQMSIMDRMYSRMILSVISPDRKLSLPICAPRLSRAITG